MKLTVLAEPLFGRFVFGAWAFALIAGCASPLVMPTESVVAGDGPLTGRIFDPGAKRFVTQSALVERASASRLVILGEAHDNGIHHRLQLAILEGMLRKGRTPVLAMEQLDREHQAALD